MKQFSYNATKIKDPNTGQFKPFPSLSPSTDKTLTIENEPADAKIVGDKIDNLFITPNSFSKNSIFSDDYLLQKALDYACENNVALVINKNMNITQSIYINESQETREPIYIYGFGKIYYTGEEPLFKTNNFAVGDIFLINLFIEGNGKNYVFNCFNDRIAILRTHTVNCVFKNLAGIYYSTDYIQSVRSNNDTFIGITEKIFNYSTKIYDCNIVDITFEANTGCIFGDAKGVLKCNINGGVIEGSKTSVPLVFEDVSELMIRDLYFEQNKLGNIIIGNGTGGGTIATIENCLTIGDIGEPYLYTVKGNLKNLVFNNNVAYSKNVLDISEFSGSLVDYKNNMPTFTSGDKTGVLDPNNYIENNSDKNIADFKKYVFTRGFTSKKELFRFSPYVTGYTSQLNIFVKGTGWYNNVSTPILGVIICNLESSQSGTYNFEYKDLIGGTNFSNLFVCETELDDNSHTVIVVKGNSNGKTSNVICDFELYGSYTKI